jgi:hypothetical protein
MPTASNRLSSSRATPHAPNFIVNRAGLARLFIFAVTWLTVAVAWGDIDVKPVYAPHEPIVATVTTSDVPQGALLRGSFQCPTAKVLPSGVANVYHVWAAPGKHVVTAAGIWVLTDTGALGGVLKDFGMYSYTQEFVVGGDVPPVPPPIPPIPPGERRAVILEESLERTPAQGLLFAQLVKDFLPERLQILDDDQPDAKPYLEMVPANVRPALLVLTGDKLVRAVPAPTTVADVKREVSR